MDSKNSQTTPTATSTTPNTPTTGGRSRPNGTSRYIQHSPGTPTTGLRERGNDTSRSTGRSGRQNAATRRNMRREERVSDQGPVKEQQPDGMSHGGLCGGGGGISPFRRWRRFGTRHRPACMTCIQISCVIARNRWIRRVRRPAFYDHCVEPVRGNVGVSFLCSFCIIYCRHSDVWRFELWGSQGWQNFPVGNLSTSKDGLSPFRVYQVDEVYKVVWTRNRSDWRSPPPHALLSSWCLAMTSFSFALRLSLHVRMLR